MNIRITSASLLIIFIFGVKSCSDESSSECSEVSSGQKKPLKEYQNDLYLRKQSRNEILAPSYVTFVLQLHRIVENSSKIVPTNKKTQSRLNLEETLEGLYRLLINDLYEFDDKSFLRYSYLCVKQINYSVISEDFEKSAKRLKGNKELSFLVSLPSDSQDTRLNNSEYRCNLNADMFFISKRLYYLVREGYEKTKTLFKLSQPNVSVDDLFLKEEADSNDISNILTKTKALDRSLSRQITSLKHTFLFIFRLTIKPECPRLPELPFDNED